MTNGEAALLERQKQQRARKLDEAIKRGDVVQSGERGGEPIYSYTEQGRLRGLAHMLLDGLSSAIRAHHQGRGCNNILTDLEQLLLAASVAVGQAAEVEGIISEASE